MMKGFVTKKRVSWAGRMLQCVGVTVLLLLAATPAVYATTWDVVDDFDTANTSGSAWSFGYMNPDGVDPTWSPVVSSFTQYSIGSLLSNGFGWFSSTALHNPAVWKNTSSVTLAGVAPGQVSLHPGSDGPVANGGTDGMFSVVRWTAAEAGDITVAFKFYEGDWAGSHTAGSVCYYVIVNNTTKYSWINEPYSRSDTFSIAVAVGDKIDFIVGDQNNIYGGWGNTPLDVTITSATVPGPATLLLLGPGLAGLAVLKRRTRR